MYMIKSVKTNKEYKKEKLPSRSKVAYGVIYKEVKTYEQIGFVVNHETILQNKTKWQ